MMHSDTGPKSGNRLIAMAMGSRKLPSLPIAILAALGIVVLSSILGGLTTIVLLGGYGIAPESGTQIQSAIASGSQFALLLVLSFVPIFLLLWIWLKWYEGREFRTLGFPGKSALLLYLRGLGGGILFFGLSMGILYLTGGISVKESDPQLNGTAAMGGVLIVLLGWIVQGAGEEVLCRGWLLQVVGARRNVWTGVIVSSLFFSALHGINPNIGVIPFLNIALVGIFLSLYALQEGSIWGVSGWHATWNWAQGNIFGMEVSGTRAKGGSIFCLSTDGWDVLTGGAFGPEGGLAVTFVLLLGVIYFLRVRPPDFTTPAIEQALPFPPRSGPHS